MTGPDVKAVAFESRLVEVRPGELAPEEHAITAVDLSNGRTLLIDDWGVIDERDLNPDLPIPEQRFFYLSWDELLTTLDTQRKEGMN